MDPQRRNLLKTSAAVGAAALAGAAPPAAQRSDVLFAHEGSVTPVLVSHLHPASKFGHFAKGAIWLKVNGATKQASDLSNMTWNVAEQVANLSRFYELFPGDIIYCGTPENVGPVVAGDVMTGHIDGIYEINVKVV